MIIAFIYYISSDRVDLYSSTIKHRPYQQVVCWCVLVLISV